MAKRRKFRRRSSPDEEDRKTARRPVKGQRIISKSYEKIDFWGSINARFKSLLISPFTYSSSLTEKASIGTQLPQFRVSL